MRSRRAAIVLLGALAAGPVAADSDTPTWQGVYEGVIGKAHVVAALAPSGARYVYLGQANDLGLIVSDAGGALTMVETLAPGVDEDAAKEHPELVSGAWTARFADGALKGVWKDAHGGHERPLALTRISTDDESVGALTTGDRPGAYDERWLRGAPPVVAAGAEASLGTVSYRPMRDPLFGGLVPRLTRAPAGADLAAVNAGLDRLQRAQRVEDRECLQAQRAAAAPNGAEALKNEEKGAKDSAAALTPTYATARLLTIEKSGMVFCGGAHPNLEVAVYTFDLADGALIAGGDDADPLGPSGLGRALDIQAAKRRAAFDALWMSDLRARIAAGEKAAPQNSDDDPHCGQVLLDALRSDGAAIAKAVYPTAQGLAFRFLAFPHAVEGVCSGGYPFNPLVVPYAALKPFLKPNQTLLPSPAAPAGK
ncbi:MAG TPA: hypothetical protein VKU03_07220 [Roseiarcus sp.]|nr:hypothetical protein [Roseiarcus sp.]